MKRAARTWLLLFGFSAIQFSLSAQNTVEIVSEYLKNHASEWNLIPADVSNIEIVSESSSLASGVKYVYVRQIKDQIPVVNGLASVAVKNNAVVHVSSRLVSLNTQQIAAPTLSSNEAVNAALVSLELPKAPLTAISENSTDHSVLFEKGIISNENIPARLFLMSHEGKLVYVWDLSIYPVGSNNWWSMRISATTGEVLFKNNWISSCSFEGCDAESHMHETAVAAPLAPAPPPPPGLDRYNVLKLPIESPNHGNRSVVVNPSDPTYSPYGWHDTNGSSGDEFTISRGNNVYATEDIDDDNTPGYSPDGGSALNFDFFYDSIAGVEGNLDAVITNLFYMNNMMHDIWAYYGFDEESGNFQEYNYTGAGEDSDYVMAEAQDGSGTDNANFGTPPDGNNPRMQMYLWNFSGYLSLLNANDPDSISGNYPAADASFGPHVTPGNSITGDVVLVIDGGTDTLDACDPIVNGAALNGKIALLKRGNCQNTTKVLACQNYGAIAVIVMQPVNNDPGNLLGSMNGIDPITIPTIVVGKGTGDLFIEALGNGETVNVTINATGSPDTYDSDFDNMVIAHEYGHGISNRLIAGSGNTNCLYNEEQMGEGWSDWFGLMLTIEPGDQGSDRRGVGTYVSGEPVTGVGIRPATYSTNFSFNNYTYGRTNNAAVTQPHGIGFIWATMLWDLNWALINEYGYDPNLKTGTGGNNIAMALVIEGLKLTSCSPGFIDGRAGILAADEILYGGEHECLIWNVFAKRGLGASADQGDSDDRSDQIESFDIPLGCGLGLSEQKISSVAVYPNPGTGEITVDLNGCKNASVIKLTDLTGKLVYSQAISGETEVNLNFTNLNKGLYFLTVEDDLGSHVVEWVKN